MPDGVLADAVMLVHLAFVLFAVFGGVLVWRWTRAAWLHLPALLWAAWVEFSGAICPLTILEVRLRLRAGETGYRGGFIEHYVGRLLYPPGLTHELQLVLGALLVAFNLTIYLGAVRRAVTRSRSRNAAPAPPEGARPPAARAARPGSQRPPDTLR